MSDSIKGSKKIKEKENKLLDLTGTAQPRYMCEECEVELFLFAQAYLYFPMEKGPHYICPECHVVTDISLHKPPGMSEIKPIDMNPPTFTFVPDDRGDGILTIDQRPYDPEPDEDKWLKNIGATLIDKRIDARSDF